MSLDFANLSTRLRSLLIFSLNYNYEFNSKKASNLKRVQYNPIICQTTVGNELDNFIKWQLVSKANHLSYIIGHTEGETNINIVFICKCLLLLTNGKYNIVQMLGFRIE